MKWSETEWFINRDRLVLARCNEGSSWQEIADELDVTRQRVRQIVHEARKRHLESRIAASPVAAFFYTERFGKR